MGYAGGLFLTQGALFDPVSGFIAKDTTASQFDCFAGSFIWSSDTGLTSGNGWTRTARMVLDTQGKLGVGTVSPNATLDIVSAAGQIRFGSSTSDNGAYLVSAAPSQGLVCGGATWTGSAWIAKDTAAGIIGTFGGAFHVQLNSGLTIGRIQPH